MKYLLTTSFLATAMVATSYSQALISESFDAATGTLNGAASGTGLSGAWSGDGTIEAEDLSYGDLQHSGNQAFLNASNTSANVSTSSVLADNGLLDDGGTLWFSTMFRGASPTTNEHSGFGLGTGNFGTTYNGVTQAGDGVGFYKSGNSIRAATWLGGGKQETTSGSSQSITLGSSEFLVVKVDWGATNADDHTVTLYNPSTTDLGNLGTGVSATVSNFDQSLLDTLGFAMKEDNGSQQTYDEIRFGATYDDVSPVPEPGSFALIGGCLALTSVMLRRRRC